MSILETEGTITVHEAAQLAHISSAGIRKALRDGRLAGKKEAGSWFVYLDSLRECYRVSEESIRQVLNPGAAGQTATSWSADVATLTIEEVKSRIRELERNLVKLEEEKQRLEQEQESLFEALHGRRSGHKQLIAV
ncbi:hypothetical protein [Bailinhaonella thermotolerans]|uniref:Helix-turn-helix domain-containing protein n=1 Tax=Bailinhaonella thermotolerans TaxID=1070861 RepID=A0A3A3ZZL9_9ACTN|nr:hypothetical protein [Bailinhaonella thermotolerans]RJL21243.1 hypothetical protein D5H75_37895 [Bailinhaonella thermotolerans]